MQKIGPDSYIPLPRKLIYIRLFKGLSYRISHPLVSNMYLTRVSKTLIELNMWNLLGDGVHSLARKFENYLQQFL